MDYLKRGAMLSPDNSPAETVRLMAVARQERRHV